MMDHRFTNAAVDGMNLDPEICYSAIQSRDPRFDGRLFTAVCTTGIYCRPICPARTPKRENVTFYPSAAAAQEAGYRPCLRCRPEASPDLGAWRGTSNTVSRALTLIAEGALDGDGDVDALAERLGMGERQFRRLFAKHLGASPVAVAQTRRILLAKQLLDGTRLPMTEIALAAGFGSLRRFNATFRQLYGRPPGALRRSREERDGAMAASGIEIVLPYAPPYDWPAMIGFLAARAIPGVEATYGDTYSRTIACDGTVGTVEVRPDSKHDGLRVTIRFARVTALPAIVARLRRLFDLGADPARIGADLSRDRHLAPLVAARPGLRVPGAWDGFETAMRAILGQQVSVAAATKLAGKLAARYGAPLQDAYRAPGLGLLFPAPEQAVNADFAALGMPGARARALSALAAAAHADPRLLHPGEDWEQASAKLRALPGIGEWTAQYVAMRVLRNPDAFLAADIGVLRAMADTDGRRPKPAEMLAFSERWRPWRSYAVLHLWAAEGDASLPIRSDVAPYHSQSTEVRHEPAIA